MFSLRPLYLLCFLFLASCASSRYEYSYVPGKTAVLRDGKAIAPAKAPEAVRLAIAAANRIAGSPYCYGGGHGGENAKGYDCSGAASYVLAAAGALKGGATTSYGFRSFGNSGKGKWITIYSSKGHVFLSVAGLRFDTGSTGQREGPRWTTRNRPAAGAVLRHPPGL